MGNGQQDPIGTLELKFMTRRCNRVQMPQEGVEGGEENRSRSLRSPLNIHLYSIFSKLYLTGYKLNRN